MKKYVYDFTKEVQDARTMLGGKGANLAEMTRLGLPVPYGFTITTEACIKYLEEDAMLSENLIKEIDDATEKMQTVTKKVFGSQENPLFVSVRSGSKFSMPGMMDTILNLGLNDVTVEILAKKTNNAKFAYDCYRRLLQMFGDVVYKIPKDYFEKELEKIKVAHNYQTDQELTSEDLKVLVDIFKNIYLEKQQKEFPQDPKVQLYESIQAVFSSWENSRAKTYRRLHEIPDNLGTAVNIQEMVFGNFSEKSGTGVAFSRNPSTGEKGLFGEFLLNAQGEDVVAGIRTPLPIKDLENRMPKVYDEFVAIIEKLEHHYQDMQDVEFTVEEEKLFILQTRNGKRTGKAAFQIATDLVKENLITKKEAVLRVSPGAIAQILHAVFEEKELQKKEVLAKGLPASPGAATGKIYFTAEAATVAHNAGEKVILVRQETSPEDIEGMLVSEAIVTSRGGMTSHAAVVARGMGVCCVVGCGDLRVDEEKKIVKSGGISLHEGDEISVDGSTGKIYEGVLTVVEGQKDSTLATLLDWADEYANLQVFANAETKKDLTAALDFKAKGIGLARTEHMFFGEGRILEMRKMILAESEEERRVPLSKLKEMQKNDFRMMFDLFEEKTVTIRLLDPPLHEFLPQKEEEIIQLSRETNKEVVHIEERIETLHEVNPMLGHRGSRLAVTYPDIYNMQAEAIVESALEVMEQKNIQITPHIMIPLIGSPEELGYVKGEMEKAIEATLARLNKKIPIEIGTMIEIPRACLLANRIAENADFFSFGTNDLTQLTYGFSRDDAAIFIDEYLEKEILPNDPFNMLDEDGVGALMKIAVEKGRETKPELSIGVCGEVGGNPKSIEFLQGLGLNYISCSPYRVPAMRLAVGQTGINSQS